MSVVVAVVDDLMFLSRIREAAKRQGAVIRVARSAGDAVTACRDGATRVILDLDTPRLPVLDILEALAADPASAGVDRVGFYSHVETERARDAQAAGCRTVLPRSAFVRQLDELLS